MKAGMKLQIQTNNQAMEAENMSNLTSASTEATPSSVSSINTSFYTHHPPPQQQQPPFKKKRNLPGNPDPESEVVALSPNSLMATNRFVCEICNKGFQRDQNLQLHKRGHNLPWKLKQRTSKDMKKKVYVCPETSCVHHCPSRALGDLTGIKKHFSRKHGEKKWKCEKCSKRYAVQSDWKAHNKVCGTKEYRCDCGTIFSRRDSFITHRAFCDALAEESGRAIPGNSFPLDHHQVYTHFNRFNQFKKEQESYNPRPEIPPWLSSCPAPPPQTQLVMEAAGRGLPPPPPLQQSPEQQHTTDLIFSTLHDEMIHHQSSPMSPNPNIGTTTSSQPYGQQQPIPSHHMSATALLQKAAQMGAKISNTCTTSSPATEMVVVRPHFGDHMSASFGLNLSSIEEQDNNHIPRTSLFQEMMNSSSSSAMMGYSISPFGDGFEGGMVKAKKESDEGMTRDFLSLKSLSQRDILSFGGLGHEHVSDDTNENDHHSWQG